MKTQITILSIFFSISTMAGAGPTVSVKTAPAKDTIIVFPTSTITLTGTATEVNPGHPILDTTWTKTSGPAATITNSSNRMTTTVTGLSVGNYQFTLTATDKNNSTAVNLNVKVISGLLPVTLTYFHASANDQGIKLDWQTNMESNNSVFIIQKSTDGFNFVDVASVATKANNGNSDAPLTYSYQIFSKNTTTADMRYMLLAMALLVSVVFISKLNRVYKSLLLGIACLFLFSCSKSVTIPNNIPASSKTEFRLKQVDIDGHVNYSEVRLLN
ncbi:MAG TPA: hypothetical protein VK543_18855 [Puia sp.]|nr:hypothetical protein [Puia sp.]